MNAKTTPEQQAEADKAAAAAGNEQRAKDAELEASRKQNEATVDTKAAEAVAKQHEKVDTELAARNEANQEGHAKNMDLLEAEAHEAQARTAHADDPRAKHTPTGKQSNRNTPRIDKDGTKHWD